MNTTFRSNRMNCTDYESCESHTGWPNEKYPPSFQLFCLEFKAKEGAITVLNLNRKESLSDESMEEHTIFFLIIFNFSISLQQ